MASQIPLANFKSNQVSKREMFIDTNAVMEDGVQSSGMGSPSQTYAMRHIFENSGITEEANNIVHCICGLPCAPN